MPAGALVVADWQLELRTTLMGATTDYVIDKDAGGIGGLLDVAVQMPETDYAHAAGSFAGDGFAAARTATVPLVLTGFAALSTMQTVWAPSTSDLSLTFQLPNIGKRYVNGRPLGLVADVSQAAHGSIRMLASFRITDPTIYT